MDPDYAFELLRLPTELLRLVIHQVYLACADDKNIILRLRLVCRHFNQIVLPLVFQTLQLDSIRLNKTLTPRPLDLDALRRVGPLCNGLSLDLSLVADDESLSLLPESLREQVHDTFCLEPDTFNGDGLGDSLTNVLACSPSLEKFRLFLPFTAASVSDLSPTFALAITMKALAQRAKHDDFPPIKVLVLDHVMAETWLLLFNNHMDATNILDVFRRLEHLVVSFWSRTLHPANPFDDANNFIPLLSELRHGNNLKSLSLSTFPDSSYSYTPIRPPDSRHILPLGVIDSFHITTASGLPSNLSSLELRRVVTCHYLMRRIFRLENLQELYLRDVYIELGPARPTHHTNPEFEAQWVGMASHRRPEHWENWLAMDLFARTTPLKILRASNLGYSICSADSSQEWGTSLDLRDPLGMGRSLAQRFVEVAEGIPQPATTLGQPRERLLYHPSGGIPPTVEQYLESVEGREDVDIDANKYLQQVRNPTSKWRNSLDDHFENGSFHSMQWVAGDGCYLGQPHSGRGSYDAARDNAANVAATLKHFRKTLQDQQQGLQIPPRPNYDRLWEHEQTIDWNSTSWIGPDIPAEDDEAVDLFLAQPQWPVEA